MKTCARFLFVCGLIFLIYGLGVHGEDEEAKPVEKTESETPVVQERSSHHHHATPHHHEGPTYQGFWKKKFIWRPRWVKTWQAKKIYVAVWKRMWGPAMLNEWVPVPKPPPGWVKHDNHLFIKGRH